VYGANGEQSTSDKKNFHMFALKLVILEIFPHFIEISVSAAVFSVYRGSGFSYNLPI